MGGLGGKDPGSGYKEEGSGSGPAGSKGTAHDATGEDANLRKARGRKRLPTQPAGADSSVTPTPPRPPPA